MSTFEEAKKAHRKGKVVHHGKNEDLFLCFDSRTNVWTTYRYTYDDYCGLTEEDVKRRDWVIE